MNKQARFALRLAGWAAIGIATGIIREMTQRDWQEKARDDRETVKERRKSRRYADGNTPRS